VRVLISLSFLLIFIKLNKKLLYVSVILVVANVSDEEMQEHYDNFFEDVFVECEDKYGEIEEMNVCDNLGDHLVGNVYIKFRREEDAERAVNDLNNRWFGGRPVYAELSPVTDFREACCRQYEMGYDYHSFI
jgi:splicing factor U2AF subunit